MNGAPSLLSMPTRADVMLHRISVAFGLCAWVVVGLLFYTLWWPFDPVPKLQIAVVGPTRAGQDLRVKIDYCKAPGFVATEVRWALVDGATIMLPSTLVTLPPGCHTLTVILPSSVHMTPGRYQLRVEGIYRPWLWRELVERATSEWFEVGP